MKALVKRLFWPKKDYLRVFYNYDEDSVNEFLGELNNQGGKVIKLEDISTTSLDAKAVETELYSGEYVNGLESTTQEKLVIHYRCFEKINYLTEKERVIQKRAEQQRAKYLKRSSKDNVKKLKEKYLQREKKRSRRK